MNHVGSSRPVRRWPKAVTLRRRIKTNGSEERALNWIDVTGCDVTEAAESDGDDALRLAHRV